MSDDEVLYGSVPREAGGLPDIEPPRFKSEAQREALAAEARRLAERRTCESADCGGERFCVHRHIAPVDRDAALHWRLFDAEPPYTDSDEARAQATVHALLAHRASPATWARCGADAERLAVLGFTLDDLVRHSKMLLEHVVDGLELDWHRLLALGFHPSLLKHRNHFPVLVLGRAGLSAERLLRCAAVTYADLRDWRLSHEELRYLGFDGPLLMHIGMSGEDILDALAHEHVRARGVPWWVAAMRFTPELLERAFSRATVSLMSQDDKVSYASLVVTTRTAAAKAAV